MNKIFAVVLFCCLLAGVPFGGALARSSAAAAGIGEAVYLPLLSSTQGAAILWEPYLPITVMTPEQVSELTRPYLAIEPNGVLHVFWDHRFVIPVFVYHSIFRPLGWTAAETVTSDLGYSTLNRPPVVDGNGRVHVLIKNADVGYPNGYPQRARYLSWYDGQWSSTEQLFSLQDQYMSEDLRLDHQNRVQALYFSHKNIYYRTRSEAGVWSATQSVLSPLSALVRTSGEVHLLLRRTGGIAFYQDILLQPTSETIFSYAIWRDGQLLVPLTILSDTLNGRSVMLDGGENLHLVGTVNILMPGGSYQGLEHQCLTSGLELQTRTRESGTAAVGSWAQAYDNAAGYALAWIDGAPAQTLHLKLWNGCAAVKSAAFDLAQLGTGRTWQVKSAALSEQARKACVVLLDSSTQQYGALCAAYTP